ncbi:unnamed protein product, partial [Mesorhabditis spiculigera]
MPFRLFLVVVFCLDAYARNLTSHNGCVVDPARPCDFVNSTWVLDDNPYFLWPFDEDEAVAKNWTQFEDAQIEAISKFCSVGDYQHRLLLAHFHWMAKDQILLEEIRKYFGLTPRRNGNTLKEAIMACELHKFEQASSGFLESVKKMEADMAKHLVA